MEKYPNIASGYSKTGKSDDINRLWLNLTEKLNSAGPPCKDVNGWKKVLFMCVLKYLCFSNYFFKLIFYVNRFGATGKSTLGRN